MVKRMIAPWTPPPPEDLLTGGLGLVVVLFAIAGVLAWVGWMRRLGFWHFLGTPSAPRPQLCRVEL